MRTILLVLLLAFSARADDIVDLNVQSYWNNYTQNPGTTYSATYNFVDQWDITAGTSHLLYVLETGSPTLFMKFDFSSSTPNTVGGFFICDKYGNTYQIIPTNYDYNPYPKPFGTPGINPPVELDIFCNQAPVVGDQACYNLLGDGPFLDGQPTYSSISITEDPLSSGPINTPEMSTGASLAAGLSLSSAFILYNRRRKEILCRSQVGMKLSSI